MLSADTIAAIATATGRGAIGIVRLSGPSAARIGSSIVGTDLAARPRHMHFRIARTGSGERIDEVLAVLFVGPHSFTGEDVVELHGHGGSRSVELLLSAVLAAGARSAGPGEFSRRAFENGRLDLTQAEGLLAVIDAGSTRSQRIAQQLLAGELRDAIGQLRDQITAVLASVTAEIDFPDDFSSGEGPSTRNGVRAEALATLDSKLTTLAASGELGRVLSDGISVALVGETNAGKSSLFNRLVGRERSLVDEQAGTTRDYVEAQVIWQGISITLVDTAGSRQASGLEERGIELGRRRAAEADVEVVVVPAGSAVWPQASARQLVVASKVDLVGDDVSVGSDVIATSATQGEGLVALQEAVVKRATGMAAETPGHVLVSARQRRGIELALAAVRAARDSDLAGRSPELVAVDLQTARLQLTQLLGEHVDDEMLDELFTRFCIGK